MGECLVLDKQGAPAYVEKWQEVVRLWCLGSVEIIAEDEHKILHSDGFEMGMPRVVKLKKWIASNVKHERVALTRRNLLIRDSVVIDGKPTVICQYCGKPLTTETFTTDHVWPRSKGGLSTWKNLVACCKDCNFAKANQTLQELPGMRLLKKPIEPKPDDPRYQFKLEIKSPHESWLPWLYWNVQLEE